MGSIGSSVLGREHELASIHAFLEGRARALVIEGEAGIGKTTLWHEGVRAAEAAGWRVLAASPAEREARLAFTVLGDLLGASLEEVGDRLDPPQRRALDVALLRVESERIRPDPRAVGLAVTATIEHLAQRGRLLLAIDDLQWVDVPSARALAFAVRRLRDAPVRVLGALRVAPGLSDPLELDRSLPDGDVRPLHVGPLDATAMRRVLSGRAHVDVAAALARRLHDASGGNPFFALELARAVEREGVEPLAGEPLPLPGELDGLLRNRIRLLSPEARELLLFVASAGRPTAALLRRLPAGPDRVAPALEEAERQDLIAISGDRVRFTHPLLGSAVHAQAGPEERLEAHRQLASLIDDPIERALHLALSTDHTDRDVAADLDDAAQVAESRGAPAVAAELSELAGRLTPPDEPEAARGRAIAAAERLFEAGDVGPATVRLEEIATQAPPGSAKAEALHRLCHLAWNDVRRVRALAEQALSEAGDAAPPELSINLHRAMGWVELWGGDPRLAAEHFDRASALAEAIGDPVEISLCLNGQAFLAFFTGRPEAMDLIRRAIPLTEPRGIDLHLTHPRRTLGTLQLWAGDLDAARVELERDYREVVGRGHLGLLWLNQALMTELEIRAGNWDLAEAYAAEGLDALTDPVHEQDREVLLWASALVAAHRGRVDVARAQASEGLHLADRHDDRWYVFANGAVLGFLELSLADLMAAHRWLAPLVELAERMGLEEPGIFPFLPDEIEALIALGEPRPAETLLERLEDQGRARGRALALAGAMRCRALLAASRGDLDEAIEVVTMAVEDHGQLPQPFDLARTQLVQGQLLRRVRQKRSAREALEGALETFERLGAPLWAEKARSELGRIGGRAPSPTGLTPTERQVADLVGQGRSNREIAAALFMSEHTVRANLRRTYAKLGIRSRTELASRLHQDASGRAAVD